MNRRSFIRGSLTALPVAAGLGSTPALAQTSTFGNDLDILNFALVAEYFLSQFYRKAQIQMSGKEGRYIEAIGADEDAHIAALTRTVQSLGRTPVQSPAIDYGKALKSRENLLEFALRFENLFARAYLGAAASIENKDILQAAAGIYGIEERHAAIIAQMLGSPGQGGVYSGAISKPATKSEVLGALKPYLSTPKNMAEGAAVTR